MSRPTDDQDVGDWRRDRSSGRKSAKQMADAFKRQRREADSELLRRYDLDRPMDDTEPTPRID